jgi:hypothetical protein
MTKFVYIAFDGECPIAVTETETEARSLLGEYKTAVGDNGSGSFFVEKVALGGFIGEIYNNLIYNQK